MGAGTPLRRLTDIFEVSLARCTCAARSSDVGRQLRAQQNLGHDAIFLDVGLGFSRAETTRKRRG